MRYLLLTATVALMGCATGQVTTQPVADKQVPNRSIAHGEESLEVKALTGPPRIRQMDQESDVYMKLFQLEGRNRGVEVDYTTVRIYIAQDWPWLGGGMRAAIGVCWFNGNRRVIIIRQDYWDAADAASREMLMFHEIAHCALNMPHDMTTDQYGYPVSIMFPSMFPSSLYYNRRSKYLDQLFEAAKNNAHKTDIFEGAHNRRVGFMWPQWLLEEAKKKPREFFAR